VTRHYARSTRCVSWRLRNFITHAVCVWLCTVYQHFKYKLSHNLLINNFNLIRIISQLILNWYSSQDFNLKIKVHQLIYIEWWLNYFFTLSCATIKQVQDVPSISSSINFPGNSIQSRYCVERERSQIWVLVNISVLKNGVLMYCTLSQYKILKLRQSAQRFLLFKPIFNKRNFVLATKVLDILCWGE
jgi:hypothetical protein